MTGVTAARPPGLIRIGTRGSALAMTQTGTVAAAITEATGLPTELVEISTAGDRSGAPVAQLGVGVFVSALREALAHKEIDVAVHSFKDLPTAPDERLTIAAVPTRADPRDALITRDGATLATLAQGGRIGTGSPRRIAQLLGYRPDLTAVPVRGNVDTRLRKVATGELDALVLARAGLARLGRVEEITETLDPEVMLPAPAQGALAVECRVDDPSVAKLLAVLDDPATRAAVTAERALLATLEAGCSVPVGGLAEFTDDGELRLRGAVCGLDGARSIRLGRSGPVPTTAAAARLGRDLAAALLAAGADTLLGVERQRHVDGPAGARGTATTETQPAGVGALGQRPDPRRPGNPQAQ
ncbi:hydroxymethylbilane synthase [Natronosporangium hydrolyticum]|uniref:Porphobilinogen deaminase n=1 Tax=Natronosporangium hydrolyticum TaxID=2811111 RepID=A0A895YG99_9ACTN|nr:hydroxymethylbilane synthase [Natronosporangium hydrolyticum]QSB14433.1 hydroxymethylbilane synthase [Natronosporangium hydrolyticum]